MTHRYFSRQTNNCLWSQVRDLFLHASTLKDEVQVVLPDRAIQAVRNQNIFISDLEDTPCWTANANGKFSLSSTWNVVRQIHLILSLTRSIWHKSLPRHISVFMWRLFLFRLPIVDGLQKEGIQLASNCSCCAMGNVETFDHVFLHNPVASSVWAKFHQACGVPMNLVSIQQVCSAWWSNPKTSIIHTILPSLILWELWRHRNRATYDSIISPTQVLTSSIRRELQSILTAANYSSSYSNFWTLPLHAVRVGKKKQISIRPVQWPKPQMVCLN